MLSGLSMSSLGRRTGNLGGRIYWRSSRRAPFRLQDIQKAVILTRPEEP